MRLAKYIMSGAPSTVVTMPTGISDGINASLASWSAYRVRIAPKGTQTRSIDRESCPTMSRAKCGTSSPTKPTSPDSATAAPPRIPADVIAIKRVVFGLAPRFSAISSPRLRVLSLGAIVDASSNPMTIKGSPESKSSQPRLVKLPPIKASDCCVKIRAEAIIPVAIANERAAIDTPIKASRADVMW